MSEPVELNFTQIRARRALELILDHVSGPMTKRLGAEVDGQVVRLAAREDLRDLAVVRVHDMTEIVDQPAIRWAVIDPNEPVFTLPPVTDRPSREEIIEQLTSLIQDVCGFAADWEPYGGELGSVREKRSRMTIKACPARTPMSTS